MHGGVDGVVGEVEGGDYELRDVGYGWDGVRLVLRGEEGDTNRPSEGGFGSSRRWIW